MPVYQPNPVFLRQAVGSILQQSAALLELVVVEDPSEVSAAALLAEFADPRLRHLANTQRTSLVDQRNRCWRATDAEFIALLDADDIAEPDRLQQQVQFLQANPDVDVVGSQLRVIDDTGNDIGYRSYPIEHEQILSSMPYCNAIPQPGAMLRRRALVAVGGYQYRKYPVASDYDLWSRMAIAGMRFANSPESLTRYRLHENSLKATRLRDTLKATLDIKKTHWANQMNLRAKLRMWGEWLLLGIPSTLTMALFRRWHT